MINPKPKVRMTHRSKWSKRARECLDYQESIAKLSVAFKFPKFEKNLIGFSRLIFRRCGRPVDLDNLVKSFFDGLEYGQVFKNDNQIRAIDSLKIEYVKDPKDAYIDFEIYQI